MGTAPKTPKADPPPPVIKVGELVLDRYRVVEQIAAGGHSVVYRGTDERLSRPVCIKVFSGLGGKSGVGRTSYEHFVQEAFALSRLTHPNTLRIYDFGHLGPKDAEGMPLQVCEFMNGGTLSQVVREHGKQTIQETVRVVNAMCAALSEAHALGIVHRDIKPQNILFGSVGGNKLPKLADFGIAKWSADSEDSGQRAEDTAIVAGQKLAMYSPSWAAPEQLAGQPVSPATDIYSLAVVAVYMLSGKAIFADEDVYAGYKKRRHADELVRDALKPLGISKQVIALLSKALAFDPKKRITKVDELQAELSATLEAPTEEVERISSSALEPATPTTPIAAVTPPKGLPSTSERDTAAMGARPKPTRPGPGPAMPPPQSKQQPVAKPTPPQTQPAQQPPPTSQAMQAQPPPQHSQPMQAQSQQQPQPQPQPQPMQSPYPVQGSPYPVQPNPYPTTQPTPPQPQPAMVYPPAQQAPSPTHVHANYHTPAVVRPPWMATAPIMSGPGRVLPLSDQPQLAAERQVHFVHVGPNNQADLAGSQNTKVRVTLIHGPTGLVIHLKGLTCFVAHLGGRPSPAVHIDQPGDISLVTPRAQEIGHIRVATGVADGGQLLFSMSPERISVRNDDCSDPILFDFGPGSEAYFVYTRGRPIPKTRPR